MLSLQFLLRFIPRANSCLISFVKQSSPTARSWTLLLFSWPLIYFWPFLTKVWGGEEVRKDEDIEHTETVENKAYPKYHCHPDKSGLRSFSHISKPFFAGVRGQALSRNFWISGALKRYFQCFKINSFTGVCYPIMRGFFSKIEKHISWVKDAILQQRGDPLRCPLTSFCLSFQELNYRIKLQD